MSLFGAIHTSGSGMRVFRTWLDAVSDNIANLNTVKPTSEAAFQARYVEAEAVDYGRGGQPGVGAGSRVTAIRYGDANGRLVSDPDSPMADENGMVRMPDIDLGDQMTQLIAAQRGYQANVAVVERARDAYLQALQIGRP
jgi:flagellar basal-body rod protein FlgC